MLVLMLKDWHGLRAGDEREVDGGLADVMVQRGFAMRSTRAPAERVPESPLRRARLAVGRKAEVR